MYARSLSLQNYGPVETLDLVFPFQGDLPKPVILVGPNGSGKSIVLSHLVNSLLMAQALAYPNSPEVETGKVFKSRSSQYVKVGAEYSYARSDFDADFWVAELWNMHKKTPDSEVPEWFRATALEQLWNSMELDSNSVLEKSTRSSDTQRRVATAYRNGVVLYFPSDRSEVPAWSNPQFLVDVAQDIEFDPQVGTTGRTMISPTSLKINRDWIVGVLFDQYVLGLQTRNITVRQDNRFVSYTVIDGYKGDAQMLYQHVLGVVRDITGRSGTRFGVGERMNRIVSLMDNDRQSVPNIFQLSSGELSLLNIAVSILRDADWCDSPFTGAEAVSGVVVIDEVDLHLHTRLQTDVLPRLLHLFPKVQFIVTTHSPFFVLGMRRAYGEDGYVIHRLPDGEQISAEEFSEFDAAYQQVEDTRRFANQLRREAKNATQPILVVEGKTDIQYLRRAAVLLDRQTALDEVTLRDGNGAGTMLKFWNGTNKNSADALIASKIVMLFDCDVEKKWDVFERGQLSRRVIPLCESHPVVKGIENRFSRETLQRVRDADPTSVNVEGERVDIVGGEEVAHPETWSIPNDRKTSVCQWICKMGTREDFAHFVGIVDLIEAALDMDVEDMVSSG